MKTTEEERGEEVKYIHKGGRMIKLDYTKLDFDGNEDSRKMGDSKKVRGANGLEVLVRSKN